MTWYPFEGQVAVTTSGALAAGAVGNVFHPDDVGFLTPLVVRDIAGGSTTTQIQADEFGVVGEFAVENHPIVVWRSVGVPPKLLSSIGGFVADSTAAAGAAESSALAAQSAARDALAAREAAELIAGGVPPGAAPLVHRHSTLDVDGFAEAVQDILGVAFAGGNVVASYNDATGTVSLTAAVGTGTGTADPEAIRDAIGAAMLGVGLVTVTHNDAADTITITTTATRNQPDAFLLDRGNHTGAAPLTSVTGLTGELAGKAPRDRAVRVWYNSATGAWPTALPPLVTNPLGPEFHHWLSWFDDSAPRPPMKIGDAWDAASGSTVWLALADGPAPL